MKLRHPHLRRIVLFLLVLTVFPTSMYGAPPLRPETGNGILIVRPFPSKAEVSPELLPLYREPGLSRFAELPVSSLPRLSSHLKLSAGSEALAFYRRKGDWFLVAVDDAGRTGWLERRRWWEFTAWDELLPGRSVIPLSKSIQLLTAPNGDSRTLPPLDAKTPLRVSRVLGDWLEADPPVGERGWLRWRDGNGRLLVTIGPGAGQ